MVGHAPARPSSFAPPVAPAMVLCMINALAAPSRRIGFGLCIIAWTALQFVFVASRGLHLTSMIGLGLQVGIAAALIFSGLARRPQQHGP